MPDIQCNLICLFVCLWKHRGSLREDGPHIFFLNIQGSQSRHFRSLCSEIWHTGHFWHSSQHGMDTHRDRPGRVTAVWLFRETQAPTCSDLQIHVHIDFSRIDKRVRFQTERNASGLCTHYLLVDSLPEATTELGLPLEPEESVCIAGTM